MFLFFLCCVFCIRFFFFKQKTAYEMRISDWSSDVCSSDLIWRHGEAGPMHAAGGPQAKDKNQPGVDRTVDGVAGPCKPSKNRGDGSDGANTGRKFRRVGSKYRCRLRHQLHGEPEDRKSTRLNSSH